MARSGRNKAEETELPYFHDDVTRSEAESRLKKSGDFLVRWSNSESDYIVSVKHQDGFTHARIPRMRNQKFRFRDEAIPTLGIWIDRHVSTEAPVARKSAILSNAVHRPGMDGYYELPKNRELHRKPSLLRVVKPQIIMSSICKVSADVIVNSIGLDTKLSAGSLARAIAATGGPEVQNELDSYRRKSAKPPTFGDVIVTSGFNLKCQYIFHVILKHWKDSRHVVQDLRQILKRVFELADEMKLKSIAIPPIGTGTLGYPKHIVAQVLYSEATDHLENHSESSIVRIVFVVNNKDDYSVLKEQQDKENYEEEQEDTAIYYNLLIKKFQESVNPRYSTLQYPTNWCLTEDSKKSYELIELDYDSKEYLDVVANVVTKSDGQKFENCIAKIERVENGRVYQVYEVCKNQMMDGNSSNSLNERVLWHGTNAKAAENIVKFGFNKNYAGANAMLFGKGVYFAKNFSYSAQSIYSHPDPKTGLKHIFQCRVLIGKHCLGRKDLMEPDFLPDRKDRRHDSAVNNLQNPDIFVVFNDFAAYPEYLISFYDDSDDGNHGMCELM